MSNTSLTLQLLLTIYQMLDNSLVNTEYPKTLTDPLILLLMFRRLHTFFHHTNCIYLTCCFKHHHLNQS